MLIVLNSFSFCCFVIKTHGFNIGLLWSPKVSGEIWEESHPRQSYVRLSASMVRMDVDGCLFAGRCSAWIHSKFKRVVCCRRKRKAVKKNALVFLSVLVWFRILSVAFIRGKTSGFTDLFQEKSCGQAPSSGSGPGPVMTEALNAVRWEAWC